MNDRELAERCARGDAAAWRRLIREYDRTVLRVLWNSGGRTELQDLRQEVWARLLSHDARALKSVRAEHAGALGAFIALVARNVALDFVRRRAPEKATEDAGLRVADSAAPPDVAADAARRRDRVQQAVEKVAAECENPARDRDILRLHFVEGYSATEIAEMGLGLTAKGVEGVLRRCRDKLEAMLRDDET